MALLPLQLSRAAVAAYCQHEPAPAQGGHLGHHEHQPHDHSTTAKDGHADKKAPLTADEDCGTCHLGHAQMLLSDAPALAPPTLPPRVACHSALHGSHIPALPECPDRRLA
ncbi:cobalt-zinc-cadmium resistance protein [Azohydromonas caseinilytica]|uniref:Cobalt-zinc-cadmium resistance protein n=1 Tax=Azohydromonas caseinilytica TaxID=2728836 RepID=A0A848F9F0_9BURK|nr:cobalt-zinc-cadmium resistance protein [Azohydromonas caseinilytica]NML16777.1 cobalt-zinc-cadmium resistance protein [Azohydromonas caseinilytica]